MNSCLSIILCNHLMGGRGATKAPSGSDREQTSDGDLSRACVLTSSHSSCSMITSSRNIEETMLLLCIQCFPDSTEINLTPHRAAASSTFFWPRGSKINRLRLLALYNMEHRPCDVLSSGTQRWLCQDQGHDCMGDAATRDAVEGLLEGCECWGESTALSRAKKNVSNLPLP